MKPQTSLRRQKECKHWDSDQRPNTKAQHFPYDLTWVTLQTHAKLPKLRSHLHMAVRMDVPPYLLPPQVHLHFSDSQPQLTLTKCERFFWMSKQHPGPIKTEILKEGHRHWNWVIPKSSQAWEVLLSLQSTNLPLEFTVGWALSTLNTVWLLAKLSHLFGGNSSHCRFCFLIILISAYSWVMFLHWFGGIEKDSCKIF